MGGLAGSPLTAEDLRQNTVRFSMSRAWRLGNSVKLAQKEKRCPVNAALESQNGKLLISGKVGVIVFNSYCYYPLANDAPGEVSRQRAGRRLLIPLGYLHPGKCEHSEVQSHPSHIGLKLTEYKTT